MLIFPHLLIFKHRGTFEAPMKTSKSRGFSRREKEMMDIVYRLGRATAAEVREQMTSPPSYSSVRSTLSGLERKGHLRHEFDGNRYVYQPTVRREAARLSALEHLLSTFFDGSTAAVVSALIEAKRSDLTPEELDELAQLIRKAGEEGR
jgi:predicted transcriptional regulator